MSTTDRQLLICHVSTVHPPFDTRIFHKECMSLAAAGHEVHLVVQHERNETIQGVHIHALPTPPNRLQRLSLWPLRAMRIVLALDPKPDIVHIHDPELLPWLTWLRLLGLKVVYDVHENLSGSLSSKHYWPRPIGRLVSKLCTTVERACLIGGLPTIHVMETIAARYPQPRYLLRNLPNAHMVGQGRGVLDGPPWRLVYLGGLTEHRGSMTMLILLDGLVRAGHDVELTLLGNIVPAALEEKMRTFVSARRLNDRVHITGRVPWQEGIATVRQAHIGLCLLSPTPNYLNSLPTKALEYMSQGLPVVISNFSCFKPIVVAHEAGIMVDVSSNEAILAAVDNLLRNPQNMATMGENGRRAVRDILNWEADFDNLLAAYEQITGPGSS